MSLYHTDQWFLSCPKIFINCWSNSGAVVNESPLVKIVEINVTNPEFHRKIRWIDSGLTVEAILNHFWTTNESSTKQQRNFITNARISSLEIVERLLKKKEAVNYKIVRDLSFLDARTEPDSCMAKLRSMLVKVAKILRAKPGDWLDFAWIWISSSSISRVIAQSTLFKLKSSKEKERIDQLYQQLINKSSFQTV